MIRFFLTLLSAILCILSFPNFDFGFFAWIALVPFLLVLRGVNLKATLGLSYLVGFCFFMGALSWINSVKGVTLLHTFIMGAYLGSYLVIFGLFLNMFRKRSRFPFIVSAPALWIAVEYLRSNAGFTGLPMGLLGHTQHHNLPLIQLSSFTGAYGVSFIVVLANAAIADLLAYWTERRQRSESLGFKNGPLFRLAVICAIIIILWVGGYVSLLLPLSGKSLSVAVIQGNIPSELKWKREFRDQIISKYEHLSEEALKSKPQLIVWPEASTPGFVLKNVTLYQRMLTMIRRFDTYMLVGSAEYPKFSKTLIKARKSGNTALFFSPQGKVLGQYLKIYLLPFGEYVPYEGVIRWPEFIVGPSTNSHIPGTEAVLFDIDGTKFGTLICSEILYPELSRCMVKKGATFLINISNEGWVAKSGYSYQALSTSVFRAVENRVNLVRATNTGISGFIDPYGQVTARVTKDGTDTFVEGTLTREILLSPPGTFYTRYGDVFAYGCIVFTIGLVLWSFLRKPLKNQVK